MRLRQKVKRLIFPRDTKQFANTQNWVPKLKPNSPTLKVKGQQGKRLSSWSDYLNQNKTQQGPGPKRRYETATQKDLRGEGPTQSLSNETRWERNANQYVP